MNTKARYRPAIRAALALLCLAAAGTVLAAGPGQVTRSAGHVAGQNDNSDAVEFTTAAGQERAADKYLPEGAMASKPRADVAQTSSGTGFWIYDADAIVYFDDDADGFYSGLDVSFDADTLFFSADVYARLYLSLEGGPWILYYTTDVFTIYGADGSDDYVVETDLIDGYPSGYYDVYIELYDWEYDEYVASYGPYENSALSQLPLEDETRDIGFVPPPAPPVSYSSGGGGSTGLEFVLISALLVYRRLIPGKVG